MSKTILLTESFYPVLTTTALLDVVVTQGDSSNDILSKEVMFMTVPQIRYREYREQARHNVATEVLTSEQNAETRRTNRANEAIRSEANAIQRYGIDTNAETARVTAQMAADASRYSANMHYASTVYSADSSRAASQYSADSSRAASKYSADSSASASKYSADSSRAASQYSADSQAANVRYSSDTNYAGTVYSSDTSASVQRERTAVQAQTEANKLAFQREQFQFESNLKSQQLKLEQLNSAVNRARTKTDTDRLLAQTQQTVTATENILKEYALKARAQDNADALNKANVALTKMRTIESGVKSIDTVAHFLKSCVDIVKEVIT